MERMREQQEKGIEMATNTNTSSLGYNLPKRDSSSPSSSSSPTVAERRSESHTLVFSDPHHHHPHHHHQQQQQQHLYPPHLQHQLPLPQNQRQVINTDPDLTQSSPIASGSSNPPRTEPPPTAAAATTATAAATASSSPLIRYRECLRNHAASMGSHVVDGCGEFMPSGEEGTPQSLKCAACDCHRNFHRKEVEGSLPPPQQPPQALAQAQQQQQHALNYHIYKLNNGHSTTPTSSSLHHHNQLQQQQQHHHHHHHRVPHPAAAAPVPSAPVVMMAFGAESSSEDLNMLSAHQASSRKRFRTKFTQQQKDRMSEFAEKLGWKIQKHDEEEVQQFCSQVGVKRQVFKVWMHNNKQVMKKQLRQQQQQQHDM